MLRWNTDGFVIRIDSEYMHSEIVQSALMILHQRRFLGARQEFLNAHKHYRNGDIEESLPDCLKALESLMKTVCENRKWAYLPNVTASGLIDILFRNEIVPQFLQGHYRALGLSWKAVCRLEGID